MPDLVAVVPSRGRPERARELVEAFASTCTAGTELAFALDEDDETGGDYPDGVCRLISASTSMVEALNTAVGYFTDPKVNAAAPPFAVAFLGDDHLPRTVGWDQAYLDALREMGSGIVYGNDLLQGRVLPTQCAMTSDIIRVLGWMAPPCLTHLFVDNFWISLGQAAGCLRYLPDVIVEHRHPVAGKAALDAGYERVNSTAMQSRDDAAWQHYAASGFRGDVEKVKALRSVHA